MSRTNVLSFFFVPLMMASGILPTPALAFVVSGTVRDDPGILPKLPTAIANARVYLKSPMYVILNNAVVQPDVIAPPGPLYRIIDSTYSDKQGSYAFTGVSAGTYLLSFSATGFQPKDTATTVQTANVAVDVQLIAGNVLPALKGVVTTAVCPEDPRVKMACRVNPVAGCSIIVTSSLIYYPMPLMKASAPIILPVTRYVAVTDSTGAYILAQATTAPVRIAVRKAGYIPQSLDTSLVSGKTTTLDFSLVVDYENRNSVTLDSLTYKISVSKKTYAPSGWLYARYTIVNGKRDSVSISAGSCDFEMTVTDKSGAEVYRYLLNRACPLMLVRKILAPGERFDSNYEPYQLTTYTDTMTITGSVFGQIRTSVAVGIRVSTPSTVTRPAAEVAGGLRINASRRAVVVSVDRAQDLALTLTTSSGRLVSIQQRSPSMAGVQTFVIPGDAARGSVLVARVAGSRSGVVSRRIVVK